MFAMLPCVCDVAVCVGICVPDSAQILKQFSTFEMVLKQNPFMTESVLFKGLLHYNV